MQVTEAHIPGAANWTLVPPIAPSRVQPIALRQTQSVDIEITQKIFLAAPKFFIVRQSRVLVTSARLPKLLCR